MEDVYTGAGVRELGERVDGVGREPVRILNERARPVQEIVVAKAGAKTNNGPIQPDHEPQTALCDEGQAAPVEALMGLRESIRPFARATGREVV